MIQNKVHSNSRNAVCLKSAVPDILECQSPYSCPEPSMTSPRVNDSPDHLRL